MKYRLTMDFEEGTSKEKIEYLLAVLRFRKYFQAWAEEFAITDASLMVVVDEEPNWDNSEDVNPDIPFFVPDHLQ